MEWEVVSGIAGIVSAICAVVSLAYLGSHKKPQLPEQNFSILSLKTFMAFLLACSGWSLCCISYLWVFEPFGSFVSDRDYQQFFGVVLAFPAILIFWFAVKVLGFVKT